jgi:iron complex outermembrane receptor protein
MVHAQAVTDEVVVTGVPHDRSPTDLAQSITVVRDEALNRVRSTNLGETLAGQLGVSSSYFGTGASRPIIRGLAGARVRTLEDGIDSMDASTVSDDHAVSVEPLVAEQIEIFRGPTTLLYGSGAVGGVINIVTTRIPEFAPEGGFAGAFELRGDSVSNDRAAAVRLDGGGDSFAWHFDALNRDSDDYEIPGFAERGYGEEVEEDAEDREVEGILENSAVESTAAALGGSWLGDQSFFGVSVSMFDSLYGVPGHHHHEESEEEEGEQHEEGEELVRIDLAQTRVDLKGGWMGLDGAIEAVNLRVAVNDYEHVELEGDEIGTLFANESTEGRVELLHKPFGPWTGALGVHFGDRKFAAIGEEAFVPPVDTMSYGVFLIEQLALDEWQLSFGGRLETQEHKPIGGSERVDGNAITVSVAGIRTLDNGYSLALNIARSERLPVAEELYSDGPHLATGAIQIGDTALGEETSNHFDIGIRRTEGDLTWSVTGFVTRYDDFIFLEDTGLIDPGEELPIFAFAQRDANFTGVEAEIFAPIATLGAGELDMRLFADYVRGDLRGGEDLPRMPPLRYGARFQYHNERLIVGIEATRYDEQNRIAGHETPTDAYSMVNADFRWRIETSGGMNLDLFVNGSNLADEEARKHTSFVKDIAPLPGRNYAVGIRSRF